MKKGWMLDEGQKEPARLQRSRGEARVTLQVRRGATRLAGLRQAGCAKAMLPRVHRRDPEVVFLNTAGGLTGGDHLDQRLILGPGARAIGTTQTAERIYASAGGRARVDMALEVGPGGRLIWCPQETILFDRAALDRRTVITLAEGAECLFAETLVLGRTAMGETLGALDLRDRRMVCRDGVPVFLEPLHLDRAWLARRAGPALLADAVALSTLVLAAPGAENRLDGLRRILPAPDPGLTAAATAWDDVLVLRAVAADTLALRRLIAAALIHLSGAPLPRVWQN
ncbi:MAG: urease accessory protein UreD [Qingshengfaniella sp.]